MKMKSADELLLKCKNYEIANNYYRSNPNNKLQPLIVTGKVNILFITIFELGN